MIGPKVHVSRSSTTHAMQVASSSPNIRCPHLQSPTNCLTNIHNPLAAVLFSPTVCLRRYTLQGYLTAKRERMDHLLDGSWCYWNHDGEPSQPSSAAGDAAGMGLPPGLRADVNTLSVVPPSLASHTVEMDVDEDESSFSRAGSSSSSSSAFALPAIGRNGSSAGGSSSGGGPEGQGGQQ